MRLHILTVRSIRRCCSLASPRGRCRNSRSLATCATTTSTTRRHSGNLSDRPRQTRFQHAAIVSKTSGKIDATYRLPMNFSVSGGLDYSDQDRSYPTVGTLFVPFRANIKETTYRVQVKRALTDSVNGTIAYLRSERGRLAVCSCRRRRESPEPDQIRCTSPIANAISGARLSTGIRARHFRCNSASIMRWTSTRRMDDRMVCRTAAPRSMGSMPATCFGRLEIVDLVFVRPDQGAKPDFPSGKRRSVGRRHDDASQGCRQLFRRQSAWQAVVANRSRLRRRVVQER